MFPIGIPGGNGGVTRGRLHMVGLPWWGILACRRDVGRSSRASILVGSYDVIVSEIINHSYLCTECRQTLLYV